DKCGFTQMSDIIEKTMSRVSFSSAPDYDTYVSTDAEARRVANELLGAH
ncbi:MAG: 1-deoxy-D-xylulose-5-phosphate reductoisomerase, partial [Xylanibacter rarus]